ncbi:MAG TPA: lantibiotic dehydratase, partial [Thermoanaerobaculia bacterium]|nr:lantibiotic dehydratase [Thermoanaerobaculia bacterium]
MQFGPSEFFVLRTPLLPFETLIEWANAKDRETFLELVLARPEVAEALALASESIGDAAQSRKLQLALARYLCRMSARPTPFGLMAGYSVGSVGDETRLAFPREMRNERVTEIGLHHINRFCATLADDPAIRARATLRPNSSLYDVAGQLRYVESHETFDGRGYQLQAVRAGRELHTAIDLARGGITTDVLVDKLARELGAGVDAVRSYVEQLVANQILVPDVFPRVTVHDTLGELAERLQSVAAPAATQIANLRAELQRIDERGGEYESLRAMTTELFPDVAFDNLLHVAMRKPADITLDRGVADRIARGVEVLRRLFGDADLDPVRRFRERFIERYEARFVPMLEALDEELGIGFTGYGEEASDDAPLLQGLTFPSTTPPPRALPCDKLLLDRVGRALRAQSDEIVITDDDVERMSLSSPLPLPDTFAAIASVGKRDVVLHTVLGPSGVR